MIKRNSLLIHATTWINQKHTELKKPDIRVRFVWFHLYEIMEKAVQSMTESRSVIAGMRGG